MSSSTPKSDEHSHPDSQPKSLLLSLVAGSAAVILGAWSIWLAVSQPPPSDTVRKRASSAAENLAWDDDDEETFLHAPRDSQARTAPETNAGDTHVRRAVHITMTDVTAEQSGIHPASFEDHRSAPAVDDQRNPSSATVWLTGTIEDGVESAESEDRSLATIPAWKRNSKPLKSRSAKRQTGASSDRP